MLQADFIQRVRACERRLYRVARTMLPRECDCEDAGKAPCPACAGGKSAPFRWEEGEDISQNLN